MSSRRLAAKLLLLFCATGIASCNFHFREAPNSETPMQMSASDSGCLNGTGAMLARYFEGSASPAEITSFWGCLDRSLELFSERTRGAQLGVYQATELKGFLEKYFLRNKTISANLLSELMELKITLLGGDSKLLTLEEIGKTRAFLKILGQQMQILRPFMPMTPDWALTQSAAAVDAAASALDTAAQAMGRTLERSGHAYEFHHLDQLRAAIEETLLAQASSGISKTIHERMPFIRAVKAILISPPGDRIDGSEWVAFLSTSAKWYGVFLRGYHLKTQYKSLTTGAGRERTALLAEETLSLLQGSISRHPQGMIPFEELGALIDTLQPDELFLPSPDEGSTRKNQQILKDLSAKIFQRFLGGADFSSSGRAASGITSAALERAQVKLRTWNEGQRYIEGIFQQLSRMPGNEDAGTLGYHALELLKFDLERVIPQDEITPETRRAAERVRHIIANEPPFFAADENEITFSVAAPIRRHSLHNVSTLFWIQEAVDLLLPAYAEDKTRAEQKLGVNFEELYRFYLDIEPLGIALKLFDPARNNKTMIATRFREGSLFTYASNGDELLDQEEGSQLLTFMLSALRLAYRIHDKIGLACGQGPEDPYGFPMVEIECYRRELYSNLDSYLKRLPEMAEFYVRLSSSQQRNFQKAMEIAARLPNSSQEFMSSNDTLGLAGAFQYIEGLFRRFDRLHPRGVLNFQESLPAFPVFRGAIKQVVISKGLADKIPDSELPALFTYLLAHGRPPEANLKGISSWLWWKEKGHVGFDWKFKADRLTAATIFAELSK